MADFVFNIAKGRVAQLAMNVDAGSPANSRLIMIPFNSSDTDDNVQNTDTVAAVEALGSTAEVTGNGWSRKTLAAADVTVTVDDPAAHVGAPAWPVGERVLVQEFSNGDPTLGFFGAEIDRLWPILHAAVPGAAGMPCGPG